MVHDQYVSSTGKIPEEAKALSLLAPATPVPSLIPGGGLLPIPTPAPLQNLNLPLVNRMSASIDPTASMHSLPPLMGNVDPSKIDEIRRTVYVGNLNSQTTTAEQLLEFFKQVGDVKFVRMAGDETQPTRFAFVEFVEQDSVARALTFNGVMFGDRPLKVNHSNNAIVKPPELTPQAAAKELENVMKRVREAQSTIAAAIEPDAEFVVALTAAKPRSSSQSRRSHRSRSRSNSRTHSRARRKRSHSKHSRLTQRSWPRSDTHSSRSSHRRLSRSRDRRHSRSRSKGHRRRSKDRSRSPRRKARSPSPKRGKKEKKQERSKDRKEHSTSGKRSRRDEDRIKSKAKPMKVERDFVRQKEDYESDREDSGTPSEGMTPSPCVQHNGSYMTHSEEDGGVGTNSTK